MVLCSSVKSKFWHDEPTLDIPVHFLERFSLTTGVEKYLFKCTSYCACDLGIAARMSIELETENIFIKVRGMWQCVFCD